MDVPPCVPPCRICLTSTDGANDKRTAEIFCPAARPAQKTRRIPAAHLKRPLQMPIHPLDLRTRGPGSHRTRRAVDLGLPSPSGHRTPAGRGRHTHHVPTPAANGAGRRTRRPWRAQTSETLDATNRTPDATSDTSAPKPTPPPGVAADGREFFYPPPPQSARIPNFLTIPSNEGREGHGQVMARRATPEVGSGCRSSGRGCSGLKAHPP